MNSLQILTDSPVIERLGWTLLHSAWQGLVVAIVLALLLPAIRRRGARASYAVCGGALLLTVLLPATTFCVLPEPQRTGIVPPVPLPNPHSAMPAERPAQRRLMPTFETLPMDEMAARNVDRDRIAPLNVASRPGVPISEPSIAKSSPSLTSPSVPPAQVSIPVSSSSVSPLWSDRVAVFGQRLRERLSLWLPWTVLTWGAGVLALSLWNLGGWFAIRRLKLSGTSPAPSTIQQSAARIARQLGLTRGVRLLQSALVDTPIVIGAIKPVILLPASLVTQIPTDQLESLLAHELAHVLRHDYLVNLLQTAIETLLFYHPAVWWISAQVRVERENCCDDLALAVASDRAVYVRALARVAGARPSQMVPAAAGGRLIVRLRRILGVVDPATANPARWLTGVAILSLCGAAIAFFAVGSRPAEAQVPAPQEQKKQEVKAQEPKSQKAKTQQSQTPEPKPPNAGLPSAKRRLVSERPQFPTRGQMHIRVVDSAGKPVPDAFIQVSIWTDEKTFRHNRNYKCDSEGQATMALPKTLWILRVWARKKGYVEEFKNFEPNAEVHEIVLPDEFVVHLAKGTTLRGMVKNEEGQPVSGARVECYVNRSGLPRSTRTDAEGRWRIDDVRPGAEVEVNASHPDYLGNQPGSEPQSQQKVTTLVAGTEVPAIVLRRGARATVKVTDPTGKPVKNAVVVWGDDPYFQLQDTALVTDERGLCRLPAFGAGPLRVTVVAEGWMPDSRMIEIGAKMGPLDFHLRPGRKLRIRFVDGAGAPVPAVGVNIQKWRGVRDLHSNVNGTVKFKIPERADQNGVFEWASAPNDAVSYWFGKLGFASTEQTITANDEEHVQTINRVLQITGQVRDAATGRRIDGFLAVPILHFRPDFPSLDRRKARQQKNGMLGMTFDRTDIEHGVQIEAPGYKTYRTTARYHVGGADPVLDIRLKPAERYTGRVLGPEGRPVKGASVSVASPLEQLDDGLTERREEYHSNHRVMSDGNGAFELASQLDRYQLVVIAPEGVAEVDRRPEQVPGEIRLQRWASLTGRLVQSGRPIPNCEVFLRPIRLSGGDAPHNFSQLTATTAADGSFAFKRVPPVACRVNAFLHFGVKSPLTASQSIPLRPAPGEAVHVELGAGGIEVTGQLVAEHQPPGFDYHFAINYLVARRPGIEPPDFLTGKGFDWKRGWSDSWKSSPEGGAYLNTLHHWFVKPEPDGRFRISGVEPGAYDFAVNLYGTTEGCLVHPIAMGVVHFTVTPGEKQVDLGKVAIPSITLPKVGDVAADFEFAAPDGTKSHLAALRGKHVLIDFWATWCGPCVAKLDEVERLRKEFHPDNSLVVVGANLDSDSARAREFLKSKPMPWRHALLGDWSSTDVPRRYAISNVPAYVLIDPAGRIVANEYSLDAIESKLKSLGEKPRPAGRY